MTDIECYYYKEKRHFVVVVMCCSLEAIIMQSNEIWLNLLESDMLFCFVHGLKTLMINLDKEGNTDVETFIILWVY